MKNILLLCAGIAFIATAAPSLAETKKVYRCPKADKITWTINGISKSFHGSTPLQGEFVFSHGTEGMEDKYICTYSLGKNTIDLSLPVKDMHRRDCKLSGTDGDELICAKL